MDQNELNAALEASPSPDRITPDYLRSRILDVAYFVPGFSDERLEIPSLLTVCVVTLDNGFQVTGESACADPANYNEGIGRKIAYDVAERKIWPLLGFMLKEALWRKGHSVPSVPETWDEFMVFHSHKVVDAAIIRAAEFNADGSGKIAIRNKSGGTLVTNVPAGFNSRKPSPQEGDILVRYSDGYLSWSPAGAFREGYRPE